MIPAASNSYQPRDTLCMWQNTTYPGEEAAWLARQSSHQSRNEKLSEKCLNSNTKLMTATTARPQPCFSHPVLEVRHPCRMYESGHEENEIQQVTQHNVSSCAVRPGLANAHSLPAWTKWLESSYTPHTKRQQHRQHF